MVYYHEKVNMFSFLLLIFSAITVISLVIQGANRINFTDRKKEDPKANSKQPEKEELIAE